MMTRRLARSIGLAAALALVAAACGDDDGETGSTPPPVDAPSDASGTTPPTEPPVDTEPPDPAGTPDPTEVPEPADDTVADDGVPQDAAPDEEEDPEPPAEPRRVLVVGDSSAAGIRWTEGASDALQGAEFTLDLESCRRLVAPSCSGREGYAPTTALEVLESHAQSGHDTLVMATGYNDHDHDFEAAFDHIVHTASTIGIDTIVWATYREDVGYMMPDGAASSYSSMNELLRERLESGAIPGLVLLDWWSYTAATPEWLEDDGVHFSSDGAYGMADMITRALAALDGRPCPLPWAPDEPVDDPCRDPVEVAAERGAPPPVGALYPGAAPTGS